MIVAVLSVVHHADDVRIREKLIPTLVLDHAVEYHTRLPRPSHAGDFAWFPVKGGRLIRNLRVAWRLWSGRFDVAVLVDPETFVAGIVAGRRTHIVFDIHENLPGQVLTKRLPFRKLLSAIAARVLKAAERSGSVTLAEPGYASLFERPHPVFENYPVWSALPGRSLSTGSVVYVGDVTEARGALDLAEATSMADLPLIMVGRCSAPLAGQIRRVVEANNGSVEITGRLPWRSAMEVLSSAAVAVSPLRDTPNYRHSLPTKVLEYAGMGVPIVATRLPGTVEVLGDLPGTALVEPGDIAALSEALVAMVGEAAQADARAAALIVRSRFNWPADRVQRFYGTLAGAPGVDPDM